MSSPGESIFSLSSISRIIPPKIAIQTIQVRGGTLNSPPFLEFLSSSLYLLSSDILRNPIAPKLSIITPRPQPLALNPLPRPKQAANGPVCKLKLFRNSQSLDPEQLAP